MSLLEMSASGAVLILAVTVLRALALHRLPKGAFLALWAVAVLRLLVPVSLPSALSVYTLAERWAPAEVVQHTPDLPAVPTKSQPDHWPSTMPAATPAGLYSSGGDGQISHLGWEALWLAGTALCGIWFWTAYLRCRREFQTALPVEEEGTLRWLAEHPLRRQVALRQSDRIAAPLTYGVLHPVILLPAGANWSGPQLACALEHELVHIQRFDTLAKLFLAAAACVHWFNPLVWTMYVLANRDIELRCDEVVVRRLGLDRRSAYARTLIDLESEKSGLGPFASAFSKNAIEERITAIMKMKKRSLAAILAAFVLICGLSVAFATSAEAPEEENGLREYLTVIPGGNFTEEESHTLFALWIDGYEDMTVSAFREKMRGARTDADMEIIERFSLSETAYSLPAGKEADALAAFSRYFFKVYEPLTADQWRTRSFDGAGATGAEYMYNLTILDDSTLKAGEYAQVQQDAEAILRQPIESMADALEVEKLSTPALQVELGYYTTPTGDDLDALLHAQASNESAAEWDRLLTPYVPFGLTYQFDDPDLDGNGLTMWFNGKEVRSITDEREGIWITEHTGITTYAPDAIELYAVYTDGVLTGLREATSEEQAAFTESRIQSSAQAGLLNTEEQREFPQATAEDYAALLTLQTEDYENLSLKDFNQRLLDWGNENPDAYNRINCDVIWNDCGVALTEEQWNFVSRTCRLSGTENGQMIRGLYTGQEQDPGFAANLPMREQETGGSIAAWCNLYYDLSYHVSDRNACTVGERDACVGEMERTVAAFWRDTDLDTLLAMTEQDMVDQFNAWASLCGTDHVSFHHITRDHIHYECADERWLYDEYSQGAHHPEPEHNGGSGYHSGRHHG